MKIIDIRVIKPGNPISYGGSKIQVTHYGHIQKIKVRVEPPKAENVFQRALAVKTGLDSIMLIRGQNER